MKCRLRWPKTTLVPWTADFPPRTPRDPRGCQGFRGFAGGCPAGSGGAARRVAHAQTVRESRRRWTDQDAAALRRRARASTGSPPGGAFLPQDARSPDAKPNHGENEILTF